MEEYVLVVDSSVYRHTRVGEYLFTNPYLNEERIIVMYADDPEPYSVYSLTTKDFINDEDGCLVCLGTLDETLNYLECWSVTP